VALQGQIRITIYVSLGIRPRFQPVLNGLRRDSSILHNDDGCAFSEWLIATLPANWDLRSQSRQIKGQAYSVAPWALPF